MLSETLDLFFHTNIEPSFAKYTSERKMFPRTLKGKGNAVPLQTWTGPGGSRRLRLTDFKTIGT